MVLNNLIFGTLVSFIVLGYISNVNSICLKYQDNATTIIHFVNAYVQDLTYAIAFTIESCNGATVNFTVDSEFPYFNKLGYYNYTIIYDYVELKQLKYTIKKIHMYGTLNPPGVRRSGMAVEKIKIVRGNIESIFSCPPNYCILASGNGNSVTGFGIETNETKCVDGYMLPECTQRCYCKDPTGCRIKNTCPGNKCARGYRGDRNCTYTCGRLKYGEDCKSECNCIRRGTPCNHITGHCAKGCAEGYIGTNCSTKCSPGTYGRNCNFTCRCAKNTDCNHADGTCVGKCRDRDKGVYGATCRKTCKKMYLVNGRCGVPCYCINDEQCDIDTGFCANGCASTYVLEDMKCIDPKCKGKYYVTKTRSCTGECNCKDDDPCNQASGKCPNGCKDGYIVRHLKCVLNTTYFTVTERAPQVTGNSNVGMIIGCVIGGLVLLAILTTVFFKFHKPSGDLRAQADAEEPKYSANDENYNNPAPPHNAIEMRTRPKNVVEPASEDL